MIKLYSYCNKNHCSNIEFKKKYRDFAELRAVVDDKHIIYYLIHDSSNNMSPSSPYNLDDDREVFSRMQPLSNCKKCKHGLRGVLVRCRPSDYFEEIRIE